MPPLQASRHAGRLLWVWLIYWVVIFAATHTPVPADLPPMPSGSDKAVHFGMYFGLTLLGGWRIIGARRPPPGETPTQPATTPWPALLLWAMIYVAYAALDELTQRYVNRSVSLADWTANVAGIATATGLLLARRSA